MKIFWVIHFTKTDGTSHIIKNIKIDTNDYSAKEIKYFIYRDFDLDSDLNNIRLRNCHDNLVPINRNIEANTKKDPYVLEVYKIRNAQSQKQNELFRPVTRRPEVFIINNLFN